MPGAWGSPHLPPAAAQPWFCYVPAAVLGEVNTHGLHPRGPEDPGIGPAGYLSFHASPDHAWQAAITARGARKITLWHLWMVRAAPVRGFWVPQTDLGHGTELRTMNPVPATDLWWVGGRAKHATEGLRAG